jgi:hypothetical protein
MPARPPQQRTRRLAEGALKGVSQTKAGRFRARIRYNYALITVGTYGTKEEAAAAVASKYEELYPNSRTAMSTADSVDLDLPTVNPNDAAGYCQLEGVPISDARDTIGQEPEKPEKDTMSDDGDAASQTCGDDDDGDGDGDGIPPTLTNAVEEAERDECHARAVRALVLILDNTPTPEDRQTLIGRVLMDAGDAGNNNIGRLFAILRVEHPRLVEEMLECLMQVFRE